MGTPNKEYQEAAEDSARRDWKNMIMFRTALGGIFALNAFAIWRVARAKDDNGIQSSVSVLLPVRNLLLGTLKYFGSYILGILAALALIGMPEKIAALDAVVSIVYWGIPGIYYFFEFLILEFFDIVLHAWWALLILLAPVVLEANVYFCNRCSLRSWRPLWIGFTVGCLGATGICWKAISSL